MIVGEIDFDEVIELVMDVFFRYGELISLVFFKLDEFKKRNDSFIKMVKVEGIFFEI